MSASQGTSVAFPFFMLPHAVLYDLRIAASALRLYAGLGARSMDKGRCWITINRLAEDFGVSRSTIKHWIRELVVAGLVQVNYRTGRSSVFIMADLSTVYSPSGVFSSVSIQLQKNPSQPQESTPDAPVAPPGMKHVVIPAQPAAPGVPYRPAEERWVPIDAEVPEAFLLDNEEEDQ